MSVVNCWKNVFDYFDELLYDDRVYRPNEHFLDSISL